MSNSFERKIQKKLQDFHLEPSSQVWKEISNALTSAKHKKVFNEIWITVFCLLFLGGGALLYINLLPPKKISSSELSSLAHNNNVIKNLPAHDNPLPLDSHKNTTHTVIHPLVKLNPAEKNKSTLIQVAIDNNITQQNNIIPNKFLPINNFSVVTGKQTAVISIKKDIINANEPKEQFNNQSAINKYPKQLSVSEQKNLSDQSVNNRTDRSNNHRFSDWSVTLATGSTNTTYYPFFTEKKFAVYTPPPSYANPDPKPDTLKRMRKSYNGFHLTAGLQYARKLNDHWSMYSGFQYSFLNNSQKVTKLNTSINVSTTEDTSLADVKSYITLPYHYIDGLSGTAKNYAHWLEVPVTLGYTINPGSKHKVELRGGTSASWMLAYQWLIPDGRYSKFYYSRLLTNNVIFNWHAAALVKFPNHQTIGMQLQQSITPLAKQPVSPPVYWRNISVFTTIPLK